MKDLSMPPFYVGQGIVALIGCSLWKKDQIFRVNDIRRDCCSWVVEIGIFMPLDKGDAIFECKHCKYTFILKPGERFWPDAASFAPIDESFPSIEFEKVLEKEAPLICKN